MNFSPPCAHPLIIHLSIPVFWSIHKQRMPSCIQQSILKHRLEKRWSSPPTAHPRQHHRLWALGYRPSGWQEADEGATYNKGLSPFCLSLDLLLQGGEEGVGKGWSGLRVAFATEGPESPGGEMHNS